MKLVKLLVKLVLLIVVVVGVGAGIVVYNLSDSSFSEPDYLKNVEPKKLEMNNLVSKSMENSKTTGKMNISLEEKELNIILKSISLDLNEKLQNSKISVETMYVEVVNSDDIKFVSYINISGFKTSLRGEFLFNLDNNKFNITIDNLKVGKLGLERDIVVSLIKKFGGSQNLSHDLELAPGIFLNLDMSKLSVTLDLLDVKDMLLNSLSTTDEYDLYQTIINVVFRVDNLISLTEQEHAIGFDINLEPFSYSNTIDAKMPYEINFDNVNTQIESLLNNGIIESDLASAVATFLVKGYEYTSDEVKEEIKNVDLSSVGVTNKETYKGVIVYNDSEVKDVFVEQALGFNVLNPTEFEGFKLDEAVWNNYFVKTETVGRMFEFVRKEDNKYESTYLAINSLYIDIKDDHFALYLLASINGKYVVVNFELDALPATGLKIDSTISSMRLGSTTLNSDEISKLLTFLKNAITDEWISIEPENSKITFDFTSMFVDNDILELIINSDVFGLKTSFVEDSEEAYTLISLTH